ncbi:MAG TPA: hypothetical protein VE988_02035 [Gemmataceae bacterium]|nr:hypothetical protein [Gemmataceae bacterium]
MGSAQFQQRMQRIEELIAALQEHGNPVVHASAVEMVRALLDVHRAGLAQTLEQIAKQGEPGQAILNALLQNELFSRLLLLHGLHPVDLTTRLQQALDHSRGWLRAHGAEVELARATHEVVELRLRGGSADVHRLLEQAILTAAPDVLCIEFVDAETLSTRSLSLPMV